MTKHIHSFLLAALLAVPAGLLAQETEQWSYKSDFSEDIALVKDGTGKYGYIDRTGTLISPCQWQWASPFSNGRGKVEDLSLIHI